MSDQSTAKLGNILVLDSPQKDTVKTAAYLRHRLLWATESKKFETIYTTTEAAEELAENHPKILDDCVGNIIDNEDLFRSRMAFVKPGTPTVRWFLNVAIMLIAQHYEQPEGVELNINGIKINLSFSGYEPDEY